jgi:hypothetical protein
MTKKLNESIPDILLARGDYTQAEVRPNVPKIELRIRFVERGPALRSVVSRNGTVGRGLCCVRGKALFRDLLPDPTWSQ